MSIISDLLERYTSMDPVQKQNFWYAVVGMILILLLLITLGDTFKVIGGFMGTGKNATTSAFNSAKNATNLLKTL